MVKSRIKFVVIVLVLIIGVVSTASNQSEMNHENTNLEPNDAINKRFNDEKNSYVAKLNRIGNQIVEKNDVTVQRILDQAYAAYGDMVENIYFADHNGKLHLTPALQLPEDYDARLRSWYKNALDQEIYKPATYYDQAVEKNIQTIAKALYKDSELVGVIGLDYEIVGGQTNENLNQENKTVASSEKKALLSEKERERLRVYVENLSDLVETENDLKVLKKHFDEQVEKNINGVDTIYLANRDEVFIISPHVQLPDNYNPSLRPWYELAVKDKMYISETFLDVESNHWMIIISTKVEFEDDTIGVLGVDFIIDL